jgi:hypothetical protein
MYVFTLSLLPMSIKSVWYINKHTKDISNMSKRLETSTVWLRSHVKLFLCRSWNSIFKRNILIALSHSLFLFQWKLFLLCTVFRGFGIKLHSLTVVFRNTALNCFIDDIFYSKKIQTNFASSIFCLFDIKYRSNCLVRRETTMKKK